MFLLSSALIIATPFWQSCPRSRSSSRLPLRVKGLNASCLVLVRLAHDWRFVGAVVVLFVLVLFIRISGRHCVAHDREGLQSILVETSSGMCGVMLLLLGYEPWGIFSIKGHDGRWPASTIKFTEN
jgi:hypothetical protein